MRASRAWTVAVALALGASGCASVALAPPVATVQRGPAAEEAPSNVLALAPTCGSLSEYATYQEASTVCSPKHLDAASQLVRAELERRGVRVVDAERTNAERRARTESIDVRTNAWGVDRERRVSVRGARFEDAPAAAQRSLAVELGVDSVLTSRIVVGAMAGIGARRTVRVQLRLARVPSGTMAWSSRCDVEVAIDRSDASAIEEASACAIRKALTR